MAERRMFSKKITDSDAFIEMSSAAQALYFHLNQSADDDGFNNQVQIAMFRSHAGVDDLKVLMIKNFIIRFESGVIVIKHWRMHNTLRKDRYNPTNFQEELKLLNIKDNGAYSLSCNDGCQVVAERLPQVSIGKDSIGKDSLNKKDSVTYVPDELLNKTIIEFIEFRKKIKAPMTEKAIELMIKKLDKLTNDNDEKIEILNLSIMNGWKGIFPIKDNKGSLKSEQFAKTLEEWGNE